MFEEILNYQPNAIAKFSKDGNYIYANTKELELRNIDIKEIQNRVIFDFYNEDSARGLKKIFSELLNSKDKELFFEYQDNLNYFQMRLVKNDSSEIITTLKNITNDKELQLQIAKDKEDIKRLDDAVRGANIGFWDFFPQEGRILANETWVTQKKYKDEDFRVDKELFSEVKDGLNKWASIVHPDDLEATGALIEKHLNGETDIYEAEFRMKCGDDKYRWIYDLGQVFQRDENGVALRMNGVHIDISNIKELQHDLEVEKEKALQATKAKSEFLANMSHEIRTPMNGIIGMSHLALQSNLSHRQKNYIQKIDHSAKSLLGIINDILDFSKIEAGKLELEKVEFDLFKVIESVVDLVEFKAHEKNLEIIVSYGHHIGKKFYGDSLRIGQVLTNLMSNAVKFTEYGEVGIYIHEVAHNRFRFEVIDTGIGLTQEEQDNLFLSFTQADGSITRKYGGTGLGLSISRELVQLMNGQIWIESQKDEGSKFIFEIELEARKDIEDRYSSFIDKKVLIVDDNKTWQDILSNLLDTFNIEVHLASSGQMALDMIGNCAKQYDLILMDWNMPHIDGIETTKQIMQNCKALISPTIIMVSSFRQESIVKLADDIGIDIFLQKPINPSILNDILNGIFLDDIKVNYTKHLQQSQVNYNMNSLSGTQILLVEDNSINQEIIVGLLEHSGIKIDIASNGEEGVAMYKKSNYELILMDLQMPVMDGYRAAQIIREMDQEIPIIALSANVMKEAIQRTKECGINDHLNKPLEVEKLYEVLLKYIKQREIEPSQDYYEESSTFEELKSIDVTFGLKHLAGNQKLYLKVLQDFYSDYVDVEIDKLGSGELKIFTHTLKGLSANIGATELSELLKDVEGAEDKLNLSSLSIELQKVIDELKFMIDNNNESDEEKQEVSHAKIKELFLELKNSLKTSRPQVCGVAIKEIERYRLHPKDQGLFDRIKKLVQSYKFKEAIEISESLNAR